MFKSIKLLSKEYDKFYSMEFNPQTGEVYFRPSWFKIIVIISEIINQLCYFITTKLKYFHKRDSYRLFNYYNYRFKKGWVLSDYFDNLNN